jgi:hypothetical protein
MRRGPASRTGGVAMASRATLEERDVVAATTLLASPESRAAATAAPARAADVVDSA